MPNETLPPIPEGNHTVTPWIVTYDAAAVVGFIEQVFDGKEKEGSRVVGDNGSIGHVEVQLGDSVIMLFDSRDGWPETPAFLRLYLEDAQRVLRKAQAAGADVITELTPLAFGDDVGRVRDPWGNVWWIHQRVEELDAAEMGKRMQDPAAQKNMRYVEESLDRAMQHASKVVRRKPAPENLEYTPGSFRNHDHHRTTLDSSPFADAERVGA
jgi:PhnB protein